MGFVLYFSCAVLLFSDLSHALLLNMPLVARWRMMVKRGAANKGLARARRSPFGEAPIVHRADTAEERVFAARISDLPQVPWEVKCLGYEEEREVAVESYRRSELAADLVDALFDLTRRNMKALYERSSWGWSDEDKRLAFDSPSSRFFIATLQGKLVGFAHYQFEVLEDQAMLAPLACLYVLELQVEQEFQRRGIGRLLLQRLCSNASAMKMDRIMLCVFRYNTNALSFYKRNGFLPDESSDYNQVQNEVFEMTKSTDN
uniref:N-alpha-acetyltransferase 40 n=1 Tax=Hanusia phi TaxID=3032 RepID=A0A7S0HF83_9CRYP|mmetsp:Transcript_16245/g.37096  ORF Transcript_16245/g.37096 Transcript_16245/m.37096 type:complete len:260 (+) Transcript_16245:83-862(+)